MCRFVIYFLLCVPTFIVRASVNEDYFKQETLDSCYRKPMSAAVQSCMIYLAGKYEKEYEGQYAALIKKATSSQGLFHNYSEFIISMKNTKKHWQSYIHGECRTAALLDEKESYAYYTDYYSCLAKAYKERIAYYRDYQY